MAFIVDDGTGLANANSLASVAEFNAYCSDRGIDISKFATDTDKENALVLGADYLKTVYYDSWIGEKLKETQALPFPRVVSGDTIFPTDIKYANIELALKANDSELLKDVGQRVIKEKVSSLEVTYSEYSDEQQSYTNVYNLVRPFLSNSSSYSHKVVRV